MGLTSHAQKGIWMPVFLAVASLFPALAWGEPDQDLFRAVQSGDLGHVRQALHHGAHLEVLDPKGRSPLLLAIWSGHPEIMQYLVSKGANVNTPGTHHITPVLLAVFQNHVNIVKFLVAHGANINARDGSGNTPLMIAILQDPLALIHYLVDQGAHLEDHGSDGLTPFMMAIRLGKVKDADYLLSRGADINARDTDGLTALMRVSIQDERDLAKYLVAKGADLIATDLDNGNTALHWAASNGTLDVVMFLVGAGADVNAKNKLGDSPFKVALIMKQKTVAYYLRRVETDRSGLGSSCEKSVIVKATTESGGVREEHVWLVNHYPGTRLIRQILSRCGRTMTDILLLRFPSGRERTIYFDIDNFFGKGS